MSGSPVDWSRTPGSPEVYAFAQMVMAVRMLPVGLVGSRCGQTSTGDRGLGGRQGDQGRVADGDGAERGGGGGDHAHREHLAGAGEHRERVAGQVGRRGLARFGRRRHHRRLAIPGQDLAAAGDRGGNPFQPGHDRGGSGRLGGRVAGRRRLVGVGGAGQVDDQGEGQERDQEQRRPDRPTHPPQPHPAAEKRCGQVAAGDVGCGLDQPVVDATAGPVPALQLRHRVPPGLGRPLRRAAPRAGWPGAATRAAADGLPPPVAWRPWPRRSAAAAADGPARRRGGR